MKVETKFELGTQVEVITAGVSGRFIGWHLAEGAQPKVNVEWTDTTGQMRDAWFLESRVTAVPASS